MTTTTLPRWKNDSESNWVLELAKHLKHKIYILAPYAEGSKKREKIDDVEIYRFKYSNKPVLCYGEGIFPNFKKSLRAKFQALILPIVEFIAMRRIIKKEKIDLILAWWAIPQGLLAAINKKIFGIKYICIAAGSDIFPLNNFIFKILHPFCFKNAEQVIVTSSALKEEIESRFPDIKTKIIPVGINDYFKPKPKKSKKRKIILCVGRLTPQKGFDHMIKALSLLIKKNDIQLKIIGEGGDLPRLKVLAKELKISRYVSFLGKKGNKSLVKYYQEADVFVLPSQGFEALGMVCAEAFACGTPVVASRVGGIKDIVIDYKTGLFFNEGDEKSLKDAIDDLLNYKPWYQKFSKNGIKHIEKNFKWPAIAKKYEQVIANVR